MTLRIKLDENLPADLVEVLAQFGREVDTAPQEGLAGEPDMVVWSAAQEHNRFFITQDLDFSDIRRYQPGTHAGRLLVRLHNPNRRALIERVRELFEAEDIENWARCLVVTTERKIRIRSPAS